MRAAKDQARQHICAVSPEHLKIAHKRWDKDEGSAKFCRPVQENLVLVAYASSEGSGETANSCSLARAFANHTKTLKRKDKDEGLGQISKASSRKFGTNRICEQRSLKIKGYQ